MERAYAKPGDEILRFFNVDQRTGLSDEQVRAARSRYGRNGGTKLYLPFFYEFTNVLFTTALPEEPPTPIWKLILEQFKDQLVIILLVSAGVSFVLAIMEDGQGLTAFVDPAVVSSILAPFRLQGGKSVLIGPFF